MPVTEKRQSCEFNNALRSQQFLEVTVMPGLLRGAKRASGSETESAESSRPQHYLSRFEPLSGSPACTV